MPHEISGERVLVLESGRAEQHYWRDVWSYRELFLILAWRDLAVRYKQTVIGVAWAVIRPLLTTLIFTVGATKIAHLPTDGDAPYALMVFAGVLAWTLFSTILSEASNSLVNNANLIGKVYFPRLIVPSATIVVSLVDAGITLALLLLTMPFYHYWPDWRLIFLPLFVVMAVLGSLGPALWMTAMNVKYRDFRYIIPFVLQFGIYIAPVAFSSTRVPAEWRLLYSLNPAVSVIDGFRWCLLRGATYIYWPGFAASLAMIVVLLWLGIRYFRRTERTFADLI